MSGLLVATLVREIPSSDCQVIYIIDETFTGHGMPNGTLCGKAVVEMLLAQEAGVALDDVQNRLVTDGDLPQAYIITQDRIERCKHIDSVQVQDRKGIVGIRSLDAMIQAQRNTKL